MCGNNSKDICEYCIMKDKRNRFVDSDYSDDLTEIPGIYTPTVKGLNARGINTVDDLCAEYFSCGRDIKVFGEYIYDINPNIPSIAHTAIISAFRDKFGYK